MASRGGSSNTRPNDLGLGGLGIGGMGLSGTGMNIQASSHNYGITGGMNASRP